MKIVFSPLLAPIAVLALTACDGATTEEPTATTPTTDAAGTAALEPTPPPVDGAARPAEIPGAMHGRWGLVPADCEPGRADAKGLLTVTATKIDFYESVGTLDDVKELGDTRIRAMFDFVGEGQEWQRDVTLEAQEGGTVLVRREDGVDAAPGEFRYMKCS